MSNRKSSCLNNALFALFSNLIVPLFAVALGIWISAVYRADNPILTLDVGNQPSNKGFGFIISNRGSSPADGVCISWSYLDSLSKFTKSDVQDKYPYLGSALPPIPLVNRGNPIIKTVLPAIKAGRKFDALIAVVGQEGTLPFAPAAMTNRKFVFLTERGSPYGFKTALTDEDLANIRKIRNCIKITGDCEWRYSCEK